MKILGSIPSKSLRFRITLTFTIIFAFIFIFGSIFIYQLTATTIRDSDAIALKNRAETLLAKTEVNPIIIPVPQEEELMKISYTGNEKERLIYMSKGFPILHMDTLINSSFLNKNMWSIALATKADQDNDDADIKLVLVRKSEKLNGQLHLLAFSLLVTNLVSITGSALLSYFLSALLLRPVRNIIAKAASIHAGQQFGQMEVIRSGDELQQLTETLNGMFRRIESGIEQQQHFFASAAHELRTPLAIMKASMQVSMQQNKHAGVKENGFADLLEEIERLERIIEDFLLVSQLNNPELVLRKKSIMLDELLLSVFDQFNKRKNIHHLRWLLTITPADGIFPVLADQDKITSVFLNLLDNCSKYALEASQIDIILAHGIENESIQFTFKNQTTTPLPDLESLGTIYHQKDPLQPGFGIGLWISKKIMDLHGGSLLFELDDHFFVVKGTIPLYKESMV